MITLDGSHSSDADGDALQYRWTLTVPNGSHAVLDHPSAVRPTFTLDHAGTYTAELVVNDGKGESAPDTATITTHNSRPVARAGADQSVVVGSAVHLDGSQSSDVDGDALTCAWTLTTRPSTSSAALDDPTLVHPAFVVDGPGTYAVQLVVSDGLLFSLPATVTITTQNSRPVANAGPAQSVTVGTTV